MNMIRRWNLFYIVFSWIHEYIKICEEARKSSISLGHSCLKAGPSIFLVSANMIKLSLLRVTAFFSWHFRITNGASQLMSISLHLSAVYSGSTSFKIPNSRLARCIRQTISLWTYFMRKRRNINLQGCILEGAPLSLYNNVMRRRMFFQAVLAILMWSQE